MRDFEDHLDQAGLERPNILDVGGQPGIWAYISRPSDITILNLPGVAVHIESAAHCFNFVEGDACNMKMFSDKKFDIAFSNSVIEHVGGPKDREHFCKEALRVANRVWIQTPSKYFPIEPHSGMPFWWYYPPKIRAWFIRRWSRKLPAWTEMVEGTCYVQKNELQRLLPECSIKVERFLLLPKSYIAIK